ncbi:MAG: SDR family NAD(P)-dependent oxidoreductase [Blastomonas fulva]|uniref:SDR family NAD(P)-dependent oxidoreductase n=1 Tax=Blastomonas fulva TaxID=1550728 RepID=UPI0024E1EED0|nr:SDR family NAD(P)-dependent oxidoreductase [Blastomonas fulva]MDK2755842.1 SDR family NAD(P)-dependent oxidoreductase [Blastomonas fulva]
MTKINFEGQVVIVTGAGGGLGKVIAQDIARRGGTVVANDLGGSVTGEGSETSASYADQVVDAICAKGGCAVASYDDVATAAGAARVVEAAMDHFGRVDAVIANAGTMRYGDFESLTLDDLNALFAVHVGGSWNIAQAAWPIMKRQGYGRVVFATSSGGMLGNARLSAYGAAKGGVMGLMHGLAEAGAPLGILCNAYMPNAYSRMTADISPGDLGDNPWARALGPYFDPAHAVGLVTYLASDACRTHHGIYSALGGRIGRAFVGITDGFMSDTPPTAETVAEYWPALCDPALGYTIPKDNSDEWRIVADQRGITLD